MALISGKLIVKLQKRFPQEQFRIENNKNLLINGKVFRSHWEGEEFEKFGKISFGYQEALLDSLEISIKDFLRNTNEQIEENLPINKEIEKEVEAEIKEIANFSLEVLNKEKEVEGGTNDSEVKPVPEAQKVFDSVDEE